MMNIDDYIPCDCIINMTYQEQEVDAIKIINGRVEVKSNVKRIMVYSELRDNRVGFNNIAIYLRQGLTYMCLCGIRSLPFESKINLTADFLSVISQIPCNLPDTAAYYITGRNHHESCDDRKVPTLKSMAFLSLHLHGYANRDFEKFGKTGMLPRNLVLEKPNCYGQVIYCLPNHLVHIFPPIPYHFVASCIQPDAHLHTYVD